MLYFATYSDGNSNFKTFFQNIEPKTNLFFSKRLFDSLVEYTDQVINILPNPVTWSTSDTVNVNIIATWSYWNAIITCLNHETLNIRFNAV